MRVKVLYTFDDQNKSNCLVRLPNAFNIPTVSVDENTQVGVIELKTCIQAIVSASPELVAKLGHDYTVYAFDFSEYETPLVGQGMLSWILASASSTPNAPAHQSNTMVTGRVCKSILGIFSNGVKETLEVKLKLVPVPTCLQSEYVENMERYRSLSKVMPEGFDHGAWAEFLKNNPAIGQLTGKDSDLLPQANQRGSIVGVESIHQMLIRSGSSEDDRGNDGYSYRLGGPYSAQGSRAASPTPSMRSCAALQQVTLESESRPGSRASVRSERPSRPRHLSFDSGAVQDQNEEGRERKRVRVEKANWRGKSSFGTNVNSLRVTASTAASIRVHQPVTTNRSASIAESIEPPQRAPTPRPDNSSLALPRTRGRPSNTSLLRHESTGGGRTRYVSPYTENGPYSDVAADSADDEQGGSVGETPVDFPSSPPIMPQDNTPSAPSSPGLPTLPYPADSGFVSDNVLDREDDVDTAKEVGGTDVPTQAPVRKRAKQDRSGHPWTAVTPGPMDLLPQTMPQRATNARPNRNVSTPTESTGRSQTVQESAPLPSSPLLASNSSSKFASTSQPPPLRPQPQKQPLIDPLLLALPPGEVLPHPLQTDTVNQPLTGPFTTASTAPRKRSTASKPKTLPRSQTWSGDGSQGFFSGAPIDSVPAPMQENEVGVPQPRSGSGTKRSRHIKETLQSALAAGQMPPYCHNCGEIETPTWRKAYTRIQMGSPKDYETSTEDSAVVGFEIVKPPEGEYAPPQYRIFKQSISSEERDTQTFQMLQLCNPCGLWFNKKASMRPPDVWGKAAERAAANPAEKPKRKRNKPTEKTSRKKRQANADEIRSDAAQEPYSSVFTDQIMPSDGPEPLPSQRRPSLGQEPAPSRPRASSVQGSSHGASNSNQMGDAAAAAALRRAIQSSPIQFMGSQHSPIEIEPDLTPNPTRRILFPSPRKEGEVRSFSDLPNNESSSKSPSTSLTNSLNSACTKSIPQGEYAAPTPNFNAEENDKENCPPSFDENDDLRHLFEDPDMSPPQATPKSGPSFSDLLKTPTPQSGRQARTQRQFAGNQADAAGLETPSRGGRVKPLTPMTPFTAQLTSLLSDGMTGSPSQTFDFSSFASFGTPGRRGITMQFSDFNTDDFMNSDLPMPSSPPPNLFSLYEDPATSTIGLWSGTSIFDNSDPAQAPAIDEEETQEGLGVKVEGGLDLTAIIQEVSGTKNGEEVQGAENASPAVK